MQEQKFELLYELGANAILDGYYREAVSSFAASLERFYQFYVEIVCLKRSIPEDVVKSAWNIASRQSERQFGAYLFFYIAENNALPPLLPQSLIEYRNAVIHKGKIPTREEAIQFGQAALDIIAPILNSLKRTDSEAIITVVGRHLRELHKKVPEGVNRSSMAHSTTVSIVRHSDATQPSLPEALDGISQMRAIYSQL